MVGKNGQPEPKTFTVGQIARLAGCSVRALRHYEECGLLIPARSERGYRLYDRLAVIRLRSILFFREMDFELAEIGRLLSMPPAAQANAMAAQRDLLVSRQRRLSGLIDLLDRTIVEIGKGEFKMTPEEMITPFDMREINEHRVRHAEETRQKYGQSDAWRESERRTRKYTPEDWRKITDEAANILARIHALKASDPASAEARAAVEEWRAHISRHYYECSDEILAGLGEMYLADERFRQNLDKHGPGTAAFLAAAIQARFARA